MKLKNIVFVICTFFLTATLVNPLAQAETGRGKNSIGLFIGIDTPFPTVIGFNAAYQTDLLRIGVGYGSVSSTTSGLATIEASTLGGQLNFFIPSWAFSPTVGIGYAQVDVTVTGTALAAISIEGFSASESHMYWTAGLDWVAEIGFYFGAGLHGSLKSGVGTGPYVNLGWFF